MVKYLHLTWIVRLGSREAVDIDSVIVDTCENVQHRVGIGTARIDYLYIMRHPKGGTG